MMGYAETQRRVRIAQILLIFIFVGGTFYVADAVVGGGLFSSPYRVSVELEGAGGLHKQSTVNYRGQQIGKVKEVRLTRDGVVAEIDLDKDVKVPVDSTFHVRNLSAVGEQYLSIEPNTADGPFLAAGSTVARELTTLPMPMPQVLADVQHLMKRIDIADIETIAAETDAVFGDGAVDLRGLTIEMEQAFDLLQEMEPDLVRMLKAGEVPLTTISERSGELRSIARNLEAITAELKTVTPTLGHLIDTSGTTLTDVQALWDETTPVLTELLRTARPVIGMAAAHLPGLGHWLHWLPGQLDAMAGSTRDGSGRVLLVPKVLKNCDYKVDRRNPYETHARAGDPTAKCATDEKKLQQRGAQNVPVP